MWVGWVSTSHALTLGDLRGAVVVGRAVDLSAVVQARADEEVSAACFKADVFHADTPQAPATVTIRPLANAAPGSYRLRVQSSALVDEPVVTVEVRSTCPTALSRRYVLLADFPVVVMPEPPVADLPKAAPAAPVPAPAAVAPVAEVPAPVATGTVIAPSSPLVSAPAVTKRAVKPKPKRKVVRKKPQPSAVAKPATVPAEVVQASGDAGKPALKLETLNLPTSPTDGLGGAPMSVPSPEAMLQASQIAALQEELKQLRAQSAQTNVHLAEMQVQLQRAQSERVSLQLFYVVVVLLLMCAAALSWLLWQRYREQQPHDAGPSILGEVPSVPVEPRPKLAVHAPAAAEKTDMAPASDKAAKPSQTWWPAEHDEPPAKSAGAAALTSKPVVPATLQELNHAFTNTRLQDAGDSNFGVITHEEVDLDIDMSSWAGLGDSNHGAASSGESILDIRQQAEFFVSLGQTERALFVLKKQIAESAQPTPAIYLDLLSLFHSLGYKTDFREYRTAFNRLFNCVLPDFPAYHLEGPDLMTYTDELARLTQVWNRKEALSYLNACIFRSEQVSAQPSFELAAFRDLLLLQAIAEQVLGPSDT